MLGESEDEQGVGRKLASLEQRVRKERWLEIRLERQAGPDCDGLCRLSCLQSQGPRGIPEILRGSLRFFF